MKNILIILTALAFLSGCFGSEKFDATDELSIKESSQKVAESLPEDKREEFLKAIVYYSLGGVEGIQYMIGAAFSGNLSWQQKPCSTLTSKLYMG